MSETTFTEAPASINLKFSYRNADIMLTLRDTSGLALLDKLDAAMDKLEEKGATFNGYHNSNGNGHTNGNGDAPVCPVHDKPMKKSKYNGWYCPCKNDDGSYCKEAVKA